MKLLPILHKRRSKIANYCTVAQIFNVNVIIVIHLVRDDQDSKFETAADKAIA